MGDALPAHVYLRRKGESFYRDLGIMRMNSVPPEGGNVIVPIDRKEVRVRVVRVDKFVGNNRRPAKEPDIWVQAV